MKKIDFFFTYRLFENLFKFEATLTLVDIWISDYPIFTKLLQSRPWNIPG
jgi:hypothetical protein